MESERVDESICNFARAFPRKKVDTWIIRSVYEALENYVSMEDTKFPIRASDNLFEDLRVDVEDFEMDLVPEIAKRCRFLG